MARDGERLVPGRVRNQQHTLIERHLSAREHRTPDPKKEADQEARKSSIKGSLTGLAIKISLQSTDKNNRSSDSRHDNSKGFFRWESSGYPPVEGPPDRHGGLHVVSARHSALACGARRGHC